MESRLKKTWKQKGLKYFIKQSKTKCSILPLLSVVLAGTFLGSSPTLLLTLSDEKSVEI